MEPIPAVLQTLIFEFFLLALRPSYRILWVLFFENSLTNPCRDETHKGIFSPVMSMLKIAVDKGPTFHHLTFLQFL